ncbi:type III secretion system chaperone [Aquabacterium sp.]|uniref:type III secretion system chaperone n=1 Tax=Aquabacterium sp. TaxID=1872578 RepID=UPI002C83DA1E|nr:type III secretion system chaperone [Aquabacterium sp.]HSW05510.1 type III secretion system chaperone [Aquabacterium sp.]
MNASDLMAEFAQRAGMSGLVLSADGTASIVVDGTTQLQLEHDAAARRLYLYTSLGEAPAAGRERYFEQLLAANLFARATGGATIGFDAANNEVLLSRALDLDLTDYAAFEDALDALVRAAEALPLALSRPAADPAPALHDAAPPFGMAWRA